MSSSARMAILGGGLLLWPGRAGADDAAAVPSLETVVHAERSVQEAREDQAASSTVITRDRTPRAAEQLPQLMAEIPGAAVTRFGGIGSLATLSLRGSSPNQVLVVVDGIPLNTSAGGGVDLGLIPVADAERIEVYRGQSPLAFGGSAIGGVVSLTTAMPAITGASAHVGGGSFGTAFGGMEAGWAGPVLKLGGSIRYLGSRGDFPYVNTQATNLDPSDDRQARRENNQLTQFDGGLRGSVRVGDRHRLWTTLSWLQRQQGVPRPGFLSSMAASLRTERLLATLVDEVRDLAGSGQLRLQIYVSQTEQRFHDELAEISFVPTSTRDRTTLLGGNVRFSRALGSWFRLATVADAHHERFAPSDSLAAVMTAPPSTHTAASLGLEGDAWWQRPDLELIPSARVEVAADQLSHPGLFSNQLTEISAAHYLSPIVRLGILEHLSAQTTLRSNLGRYVRLPSTMERYGNTGLVHGNADLQPERGWNADLGATWGWHSDRTAVNLEGALFGALVDDLIQFQKAAYFLVATNVGKARIVGTELAFDLERGRFAHLLLRGTFTDARDTGGPAGAHAPLLPHLPRLRAYLRPEVRRLPLGRGWQAGLYVDADFTDGNYLAAHERVPLPARLWIGMGVALDMPGDLRLIASAQNLNDSRVNDVNGYPLPGRSLFLTLQGSVAADHPP